MQVDLLIEGGIVLTMDPQRRIIKDGAVAIQGNQITEVGKRDALRKKYPSPKRVIDSQNKLVMPGLVNTHGHLCCSTAKGLIVGNYGYGNPWLQRTNDMLASPYWNEESWYQAALLTSAELIKNGTTSIVDCGTFRGAEEAAIEAVTISGLRAALGLELMDIFKKPGYWIPPERRKAFGSTRDNVKRVEDMIKKYHRSAGGRVNIWACLMQVMNSSDDLCKAVKNLVDRYETGVTVHSNVMRPMTEVVRQAWGMRDAERLAKLGVLDRNCLLAHSGDLNGDEVMLIKENRASIAHCIYTSMNLAYGTALFSNFAGWLQMGINIGLGTDAQICCNHMDMFRAMAATFLVHKEGKFDCNLWPPQTVLEMATLNGAKAMLLEKEIGSLEAGKKADILLIDLMRPEWIPWHKYNLIENLILSATGDCVDTSIIDGKVVMEGREIKTFDEKEVLEKAQQSVGELLETLDFLGEPYPEKLPPLW